MRPSSNLKVSPETNITLDDGFIDRQRPLIIIMT